MRIMSMGAGVQTTALLIKWYERYQGENSHVVFADTGDEKPSTYKYIEEHLKPFCVEHKIHWATVKNQKWDSLMSQSMIKKTLPLRMTRACTREFKISPIKKFARSIGAKMHNPCYEDIGISWDEASRAKFTKYEVSFLKKVFPLVDWKVTREDCYDIIKDYGWELPEKSGCDFCPFRRRSEFVALWQSNPERFKEIVAMEQNDRKYPQYPLDGKRPLDEIMKATTITDFSEDEDTCKDGHCFI